MSPMGLRAGMTSAAAVAASIRCPPFSHGDGRARVGVVDFRNEERVDDTRIAELTAEVLADLRAPQGSQTVAPRLEERVEALEAAVHALQQGRPVAPAAGAARPAHPSLQLLALAGGGERCVMEPDKPCVESGMCRSFGH